MAHCIYTPFLNFGFGIFTQAHVCIHLQPLVLLDHLVFLLPDVARQPNTFGWVSLETQMFQYTIPATCLCLSVYTAPAYILHPATVCWTASGAPLPTLQLGSYLCCGPLLPLWIWCFGTAHVLWWSEPLCCPSSQPFLWPLVATSSVSGTSYAGARLFMTFPPCVPHLSSA